MSDNIKFGIVVKKDKKSDNWMYEVSSLGLCSEGKFGTLGQALDAAVEEIRKFFSGIIRHEDGNNLSLSTFTSTLKLDLWYRVVQEKPLTDFGIEGSLVNQDPGSTVAVPAKRAKVKA